MQSRPAGNVYGSGSESLLTLSTVVAPRSESEVLHSMCDIYNTYNILYIIYSELAGKVQSLSETLHS
jgi:hypothetical protein